MGSDVISLASTVARRHRVDELVRAAIDAGARYVDELDVAATPAEIRASVNRLQCALEIVVVYDMNLRDRITKVGGRPSRKLPIVRAVPAGWVPQFDAMAPEQKAIVCQFARELSDREGVEADPVRILEVAEALYRAERDFAMRSQPVAETDDEANARVDREIRDEWGLS